MPYTLTSWNNLRTKMQLELDSRAIFYTDLQPTPEVALYLSEALREWNCLTNRFRAQAVVNLVPGQIYYDLNTLGIVNSSITDQQIIKEVELHMLETPGSIAAGTSTNMFSTAEVWNMLNVVRDEFLMETGVRQAEYNSNPLVPAQTMTLFPEGITDPRRAVWRAINNVRYPLYRMDEFEADTALQNWRYQPLTRPFGFSVLRSSPLEMRVVPGSANPGIVDILATDNGPTLVPTLTTALGVPDELCWVVKWGLISKLLSKEYQSRDPLRAKWAQERYQEGIEVAKTRAIITGAQILGKWLPVGSIHDLDTASPNWMNTTGIPRILGASNYVFVVSPIPTVPYQITLDLVQDTQINLAGNLQLPQEDINAVLNMAHTLAAFKEGGVEFSISQAKQSQFIAQAGVTNSRVRALSIFKDYVHSSGRVEQVRRPFVEGAE